VRRARLRGLVQQAELVCSEGFALNQPVSVDLRIYWIDPPYQI